MEAVGSDCWNERCENLLLWGLRNYCRVTSPALTRQGWLLALVVNVLMAASSLIAWGPGISCQALKEDAPTQRSWDFKVRGLLIWYFLCLEPSLWGTAFFKKEKSLFCLCVCECVCLVCMSLYFCVGVSVCVYVLEDRNSRDFHREALTVVPSCSRWPLWSLSIPVLHLWL